MPELPRLTAISRVELENVVYRDPGQAFRRRDRLDTLLASLTVPPFDDDAAAHYRDILSVAGHSKPRTFDRMIAATALVHGATLITMNAKDYRDIPELKLEPWPSPRHPF